MPTNELRQDQHDALITRDFVLKGRRVREAADAELPGDYITKRQLDALIDKLTALQGTVVALQLQLNIVRKRAS